MRALFVRMGFKDIQEENINIFWHSMYEDALKILPKYLNLSQIMIIESDELKHSPVEVLTKAENFLCLPHYIKKVQVGKDREKAQSEKDSHSKNRDGKKLN